MTLGGSLARRSPHEPKRFCGATALGAHPRPLSEVLAERPAFRSNRGKRHPLAALLALACCAMLCGSRSYSAIAEWGRHYGGRLRQALGFTHTPPCAATLHTVLRRIDRGVWEAQLSAWTEGLLCGHRAPAGTVEAIALDGKTLRGSRRQGAPGAHLLSAFAHRIGLTLAQHPVADATNEIPEVLALLRALVLAGRVVTGEALLAQRHIAHRIVEAQGDYVMRVKDNQPHLREDMHTVFALPPIAGERRTMAETVDSGHGRIEQRRLRTSTVLGGYSDWPGLAQVFQIERQVIVKKTGQDREAVVAGVTS